MVWTGSMSMAPSIEGGIAVNCYAGIDVWLEQSSVCVVDATGRIVREGKVPSEPEALVAFLREVGVTLERVGLEAGPLSQWSCSSSCTRWRTETGRRSQSGARQCPVF